MLINFCHPELKNFVRLSSGSVPADEYDLTNFQSQSVVARQRGFSAERFIKPPVDIFVIFSHPVNVACVVVETGNDKAGLELWTPSVVEASNSVPPYPVYERRLSQARAPTERASLLMFYVGSQSAVENEIAGSFQPHVKFSRAQRVPLQRDRCFSHLKCFAVRIYFVCGAAVPKLKALEVWARPAVSLWRPKELDNFRGIYAGLMSSVVASGSKSEVKSMASGNSTSHVSDSGDAKYQTRPPVTTRASSSARAQPHPAAGHVLQEFPAEFYDSITNELMQIPVLLPSGNHVDATTLAKLGESDKRWGREPTDPFTGKRLTSSYKAEVNSGLKARIDSMTCRRRLTGPATATGSISKSHSSSSSNAESVPSAAIARPKSGVLVPQKRTAEHAALRTDSVELKQSMGHLSAAHEESMAKRPRMISYSGSHDRLEHEQRMKEDLDSALRDVLGDSNG